MLVRYLAHDLFDHVFEGDDAGGSAVFVDHDGKLRTLSAEVLEQGIKTHGFGNPHDLAHNLFHARARALGARKLDRLARLHDAHNVIFALVGHGKAGLAGVSGEGEHFRRRLAHIDADHRTAMRHHVGGSAIGKL